MEKKNNKKILIITGVVVAIIAIAVSIIIIKNSSENEKNKGVLTKTQVQNMVMKKVNNNDIYIDDVGKVKSIKNVKYIETINKIEYWKMDIEYELSSLSAPTGKNYSGTSLRGTFCFAYNTENKKCYEYMFEINEYGTLKGWSKAHKDIIDSWV